MFKKLLLIATPKRMTTKIVAFFARLQHPKPLVQTLIRNFVRKYNIDIDEFERDLKDFPSLQEFFIRKLKPGLRPIDEREDTIVSPVDGEVSQCGKITNGRLLQIKGKDYSLSQLITNPEKARQYEGGDFITIYLSPSDYHRIHAPISGRLTAMEYNPGRLLPVNAFAINNFKNLLASNERLTTFFDHDDLDNYAVVKVGALIVGGIRVAFNENFYTNRRKRHYMYQNLEESAIEYEKGQEYSRFEFGSTVVLLFPPNKIEMIVKHTPKKVKLGQPIAYIKETNIDEHHDNL